MLEIGRCVNPEPWLPGTIGVVNPIMQKDEGIRMGNLVLDHVESGIPGSLRRSAASINGQRCQN